MLIFIIPRKVNTELMEVLCDIIFLSFSHDSVSDKAKQRKHTRTRILESMFYFYSAKISNIF